MKKLLIVTLSGFTLLNLVTESIGQSASVGKMKGIWQFIPNSKGDSLLLNGYTLFIGNKSIDITYWRKTKAASTYSNPFSYFGFWDSERSNNPKRLSELDSVGNSIYFYDFLGRNYDPLGNLIGRPRSLWVSYNEDEDSNHEPAILRFYRTGTPNVYVRAKAIPDSILLALKRNSKDWQNYTAFVGMTQKKVRAKQATIYQSPDIPSKTYLIGGDEVQVLQDKKDWYRIRYYGKKVIEGWLRRIDVD